MNILKDFIDDQFHGIVAGFSFAIFLLSLIQLVMAATK